MKPEQRKITFVNQYLNHLFVDIINVFINNGYQVTAITGGIYCDKTRLDKEVKVIQLNEYKRNSFLVRIFSWGLFTFLGFFVLLFTRNKIVLSSNPPFLFPLISLFNFIFKTRISLVVYDLYPEALINLGYFRKNSSFIKIWKRLNKKLFTSSTHIFTISDKLHDQILAYLPEKEKDKVYKIPVWGDDQSIRPIPKQENPFIKEHDLSGFFIVMYSGNFGLTHDIETILETAAILKNTKSIKFLLIGDGAKKKAIEKYVNSQKLENVLLLPWQPVENFAHSLSSADAGLITLSKNAELVSLPSKTFSYMKAGVAMVIISEDSSDLSRLIAKYKCGVVCSPGNSGSLANELIRLKENRDHLEKLSENSLKASANFSSANAVKFYEVIVENC